LAWKNSSNSFTHQYDTDGRSILRGLDLAALACARRRSGERGGGVGAGTEPKTREDAMNEAMRLEIVQRRQSGMSQRAIADELGITRGAVQRVLARVQ